MGRPKKIHSRDDYQLSDRLISTEEAKEIIDSMTEQYWTYKRLSRVLNRNRKESIQIMNDLVHYGLMKHIGMADKQVPLFERCPNGSW